MSLFVFLAVMGAALLHASWNALIKVGLSKLTSMVIMTLIQGCAGAIIASTRALPEGQVWLWLIGSGAFHAAYKLLLAYAYEHGDLSRVYPIARGAAPMMVLVFSLLFLADDIGRSELIGIVVLGAGILTMARGVFTSQESRRLLPFALGSALATAGYSIVDGLGARVSEDVVTFVAWLFVFDTMFMVPASFALKGRAVLKAPPRAWLISAAAAGASYGAYAVAVWAMTQAPIALVSALREVSILFAVLIGWLIFGERMDRGKAVAASLIVGGVILTRL